MLNLRNILFVFVLISISHTILCQSDKSLKKNPSLKELLETNRQEHLKGAINSAHDTFPIKFAWHTFKLPYVTKDEADRLSTIVHNRRRWTKEDYTLGFWSKVGVATFAFLPSLTYVLVYPFINKNSFKTDDILNAKNLIFVGALCVCHQTYKTAPYLMEFLSDATIKTPMHYSIQKKIINSASKKEQ